MQQYIDPIERTSVGYVANPDGSWIGQPPVAQENNLGSWSALANIPAITAGVGTQGDFYIVSVGNPALTIDQVVNPAAGDIVYFDAGVWKKQSSSTSNVTVLNTNLNPVPVSVLNDVGETIWVDSTGTYYIRSIVSTSGTPVVTYTLADGTPYVPVAPSIPAASGTDKEVNVTHFVANTAGTGYSVGDLIDLTTVYDTALNTVVASIYFNLTTNAVVTPTFSHLSVIEGIDKTTVSTTFRALTTNTGYMTGDIINRITTLSTVGNTTTIVSSIYENLRTNSVITPVYSEIEQIDYRARGAVVSSFRAIAAGTGFSNGDLIEKMYALDLTGGGIINISPYYYNTTTNLLCTPLMTQIVPLNGDASKLNKIKEADDFNTQIIYLDAGNATDRRPDTIIYSSTSLGLSVFETYTYAGSAGDYYCTNIQLS